MITRRFARSCTILVGLLFFHGVAQGAEGNLRDLLLVLFEQPKATQKPGERTRSFLKRHPELLADLMVDDRASRLIRESGLSPLLGLQSTHSVHSALRSALREALASEKLDSFPLLRAKALDAVALLERDSPLWNQGTEKMADLVRKIPEAARNSWIDGIPEAALTAFESQLDQWIDRASISRHPTFSRLRSSVTELQVQGAKPEEIKALSNAILGYFDRLPLQRKRTIIRAWLALPSDASETKQIATVIQETGPVMQKLFQLLAGETKDPEIKALLKELQANVRPFPLDQAKAMIETNLGKRIDELFVEFPQSPFAAGTVGQVYRAKLRDGGDYVAVKVQRPNILERLLEDMKTLKSQLQDNQVARDMLEKMTEHFRLEMDLPLEAKNLDEMARYRNPKMGIDVPRRRAEFPITKQVLIMDLVKGESLSRIQGIDPAIKSKALSNASEIWFEEAIFGSGFFHGDAHGGNLMLNVDPKLPTGFTLTFLDAGSVDNLTLEQRRKAIHFSLGIATGSPSEAFHSLVDIAKIPKENQEQVRRLVEMVLDNNKLSIFEKSNEILMGSVRLGAEIDGEYLVFSRSLQMLDQQLTESNRAVRIANPKAKVKSVYRIFVGSTLKHVSTDIPRQIFDSEFRKQSAIEIDLPRRALVGYREAIDLWFREKAKTSNIWKGARSCAALFGLLPR